MSKKTFILIAVVLSAALLLTGQVFAGSLDSPGAPSAGSGMPSLQGICTQMDTGALAPLSSGPFGEPGAGPGSTMCTLTQIRDKAPQVDASGAGPGEVLSGKKYWGLLGGSWGLQTGTLATQTPGNTTTLQPAGFYNAFNLSTVDTDLASGNIKSGVMIFGVSGNANVIDTTEAASPAAAANISAGKIAFVNGAPVTGTMSGGGYPCTTGNLSPLGRWCDNGNGTVRDMTTGLIWLQDAGWGGWYCLWVDMTNITSAHDRASNVKNGNPASLSDGSAEGDWRLPTKSELVGITTGTEYIRDTAMYKFSSIYNYYWSSTTLALNRNLAWFVDMSNGSVVPFNKGGSNYVWPVRAGQ